MSSRVADDDGQPKSEPVSYVAAEGFTPEVWYAPIVRNEREYLAVQTSIMHELEATIPLMDTTFGYRMLEKLSILAIRNEQFDRLPKRQALVEWRYFIPPQAEEEIK